MDAEAIAEDTLAFVKVKSETGQEGPGSDFLANLLRREGIELSLVQIGPPTPHTDTPSPGLGNCGRLFTVLCHPAHTRPGGSNCTLCACRSVAQRRRGA